MQRQIKTVLWQNNDETHSAEYFTLAARDDGFILAGTVILILENLPALVSYTVESDLSWKTRKVTIRQNRPDESREINIRADENQNWFVGNTPVDFAHGLYDIDLEIAPSTNTLPIHRKPLQVGESVEVDAVWVRFPNLELEPLKQRYTRLSPFQYRYEAPALDFETLIDVDEQGLVVHYHGLWRRINL